MTLPVEWRSDPEGRLRPFLRNGGPRIAWAPQPGSQERFLACSYEEALYAGTRGPGKTQALLADFAQFCGRGFGSEWTGILFRRSFPELKDIIAKSIRLFSEAFPQAVYHRGDKSWVWPDGETLLFRFFESPEDYAKYHGHSYTWIGWEELTAWPTDECYRSMFSVLRSSSPSVPRRMRATTNPGGLGHNWVKARWQLPIPHGAIRGPVIRTKGEPDRVAFHGRLRENRVMLQSDPFYEARIRAAANTPAKLASWIDGSWDIVAGGMFDDLWRRDVHIVPPISPALVPEGWQLDRAYDDGQSKPFSVGWWAESNGEPIEWEGRQIGGVAGDLIRVAEWYGWTGTPNEGLRLASRDIAKGIIEREQAMGIAGRVLPGPADTSIWNSSPTDLSRTVASDMLEAGVSWERADKGPGSRTQGWTACRQMFKDAVPADDGRREKPGIYVSSACVQFLRTIPVLQRDERNPDDVDTDDEDHIADEMRYRVRRVRPESDSGWGGGAGVFDGSAWH